jgi:diadenosine tetraphosphatase ApaH/serine/threonine PP2A family protein phosphatase
LRYLVISDVHSNLEALEAVLDDAGSVDGVWCLGDIVGYGPDPNGCVETLRSGSEQCIAGNHDWATVGKLDLDDFHRDARLANLWNREQLAPESLAYLDALTETLVVGEFTLAHGSPRNPIWEYVLDGDTAYESFSYFEGPFCLVGHTHVPVLFGLDSTRERVDDITPPLNVPVELGPVRFIINPGSVGQPRDGDPRASYVLLDTGAKSVEFRRVAYPFRVTQQKMTELGLPPRLVTRLQYGW